MVYCPFLILLGGGVCVLFGVVALEGGVRGEGWEGSEGSLNLLWGGS